MTSQLMMRPLSWRWCKRRFRLVHLHQEIGDISLLRDAKWLLGSRPLRQISDRLLEMGGGGISYPILLRGFHLDACNCYSRTQSILLEKHGRAKSNAHIEITPRVLALDPVRHGHILRMCRKTSPGLAVTGVDLKASYPSIARDPLATVQPVECVPGALKVPRYNRAYRWTAVPLNDE
jgi:hypothetical protein